MALLVIAGTSGAGKGTIGRRLLQRHPDLWWSVSATSRPPRSGEVDGRDYRFMTREGFEALRDAGGFLEWFEVYGDLKGTPRQPIEERLAAGEDVLLEVDVKGALAVQTAIPDAVLVFIRAPSREVQRARLEGRGDDGAAVEARLAAAEWEESMSSRFDHVVVNDDLDQAVDEVSAILKDSRSGSA